MPVYESSDGEYKFVDRPIYQWYIGMIAANM